MGKYPVCGRLTYHWIDSIYPEVVESGFLCRAVFDHYTIGDDSFTNANGFHCNEGFLKVFPIEIIQGNGPRLLTRPNMVLISESFAQNYLGDENPVGKIITQYPAQQFEIEAVFKDFPQNTHFSPDLLISFHDDMFLPPPLMEDWGEFSFYTYLELGENADLEKLEKAITSLCTEKNEKRILESDSKYSFYLQPIHDIHTGSHLKNEITVNVRADYLNILHLVSIFILIISGFNYIYFTYTRLSDNAIQYGIRRVSGAGTHTFLFPFLVESLIIHLIALAFAGLAAIIFQPFTAGSSDLVSLKEIPSAFWINLALIVLLSACLNPLILLNIFTKKSILVLLAGNKDADKGAISFKKIFTISQFAVIVLLFTTALGMGRQILYLETKEKGIDIYHKLVIRTPSYLRKSSQRIVNLDAFENEIKKLAGVQSLAVSNNTPGDIPAFAFSATEHKDRQGIKIALFIADSSYLEVFGIDIIEGEKLRRSNPDGCIINRTTLFQLGYTRPEEVIGKTLHLNDESGMQTIECHITGVCEDINFTNVKELPDPIILLDWTAGILFGKYTLALYPKTDVQNILKQVEPLFKRTFPNYSFEYYWVEDYYNRQFKEDHTILRTLKGFEVIAILLGVLSLLSMVRHFSQARMKDIGIRKVYGATSMEIIYLLNRKFISQFAIAEVTGILLSWLFLSEWLNSFAYKQRISLWTFLISAAVTLLIGLLTVTIQSYQVARKNPVDSLRYE